MELPPLLSLTHWYVHPHCRWQIKQKRINQQQKSTSSRGTVWYTLMGAIFSGTCSIVFQMSMLAMVPFLAAIASTHAHMKGEDISSQRSIVHLLQFMKCLNDTTKTPNPREKRGLLRCCYSCDIFRNVQKDTKGIVGSSTSSGVRSYHVGNYHGRESATAKCFVLLKREGSFPSSRRFDKISGREHILKAILAIL